MTEQNNSPQYERRSRGHKTKGYTYKDRYIHDKMCPECGGTNVYKDEWHITISYKCMKRSCRYNWFEQKEIKREKDTSLEEGSEEKVSSSKE